MEKILITGSTGLLGSQLSLYLKKNGHDVVTHSYSRQADILFDLSDRRETALQLEKIKPTIIINLASLTSVEVCEEDVRSAYSVNTLSVENIVSWIELRKSNCHLVHISTDHVYDGLGPHQEDDVALTNTYAYSKYAGELSAKMVHSTILRTNFVGRSSVVHRESLTDWVFNTAKLGQDVQILNDIYFSPISISLLMQMIELTMQKKICGLYNLGSHNGMSKADFDILFANYLQLTTKNMERIDSNNAIFLTAYRPKDMRMDCTKFEKTFGIKLPDLNDVIQEVAKDYSEII